jgi:hypothetical protein
VVTLGHALPHKPLQYNCFNIYMTQCTIYLGFVRKVPGVVVRSVEFCEIKHLYKMYQI